MFRQDRTNPSTAVSNWRGRHDTPKAWPSTAVSTWLNGGLFGAAAGGGFAYVLGTGQNASYAYLDFIDKFAYADDTRSTLSATMDDGFKDSSSMGNPSSAAYCTGGENATVGLTDETNKIAFADDTHSMLTSTLSTGFYGGSCLSNAGVKGYYCGGNKYPIVSTIQLLTFSTEAWSTSGTSLNYAPLTGGSFNNNAVAGYVLGTYTGSTSQIDKVLFSNDSVSTLSATLSPAGGYVSGGMGDAGVAGYVKNYGSPYTTIQKITFATDAHSALSATATKSKYQPQTSATGTAGYFIGGKTDATNASAVVERLEFPAETVSTISAVLSAGTSRASAATNELALA